MKSTTKNAGFTLVELVVTAAVLGVFIILLLSSRASILQLQRNTAAYAIASQIAATRMEIYRNTSYANIPLGTTNISTDLATYPQLAQPKSGSVTVTELVPQNLKQVDIVISYTLNRQVRNLKLTSIIAARGIDR